jgi:hypothetical protein
LILPAGIKRIGEMAFEGCSALQMIRIPVSATEHYRTLLPDMMQSHLRPMPDNLGRMERLTMEMMCDERSKEYIKPCK